MVIHGVLEGFFETGTEGVIWIVYEDGFSGYEGIRVIEEGDTLTIFDYDQKVLFSGVIKMDRKTGWQPYPLNPKHGQPVALGMWVHWIQEGFKPDAWATFFFKDPPLRAELQPVKRDEENNTFA